MAELLSPDLWSIESDSGAEYLWGVYHEERDILIEMIASRKTYNLIAKDNPSLTPMGRAP